MNYSDSRTAEDIMLISSKLLTLIDLAGHQKYFKTTILGLVGHAPHCFMFVVNARTGLGLFLKSNLSSIFSCHYYCMPVSY